MVAPKSNEKEAEVVQPAANVRASNAQWKPAPQQERWGVWGRGSVRMSGANDTPLGANNRPDPTPPAPAPIPTPVQTNDSKKESKRKTVETEVRFYSVTVSAFTYLVF